MSSLESLQIRRNHKPAKAAHLFRSGSQNGRGEAVLGCNVEVLTKGFLSLDPRGSARMPNNSSAMVRWRKTASRPPGRRANHGPMDAVRASSPRRPHWYRAGSFEAHRLSGTRVAAMFKCLDIGIGEADLPAHLRKGGAEPQPALGSHGGLQNGAHFRFRAAIVLRRADFPLVAAPFSSAIVLQDRVHEGDMQRDRPSGTVEQHAKPAARSTEPENDSLLAAQTRSSRFANDYTLTHGPVVERTFTGACHFECPRTLPVPIPTTPKETICTSGPSGPTRLEMLQDSHNRGPTPSRIMCMASSAWRFRAGLDPPVGVRTSRMLVYFELEDPFCSGVYQLV